MSWVWPWVIWLDKNLVKSGQPGQVYESLSPGKSPEELEKANPKQAFFRCGICGSDCEVIVWGQQKHILRVDMFLGTVGSQFGESCVADRFRCVSECLQTNCVDYDLQSLQKTSILGPQNISSKLQENSNPTGEVTSAGTNQNPPPWSAWFHLQVLRTPEEVRDRNCGMLPFKERSRPQIVIHGTVGNSAVILKNSKNVKNPSKQKAIQK